MKIIHQSALDKSRWDQLVADNSARIFSCSWYLDACAQDWYVLVDADFQNGIALPFTEKLGIRVLYPPVFMRELDFIGTDMHFQREAQQLIRDSFPAGQFQTTQPWNISPFTERIYQQISGPYKLNQQAIRMVRKAGKSALEIRKTNDWPAIYAIICAELSDKISEFNPANLRRLQALLQQLEAHGQLHSYGIFNGQELTGGLLFMQQADRLTYLKGAAMPASRDAGGMYLGMEQAIQYAQSQELHFDFGGSSVPGVRRFNLNMGGTDKTYFSYNWDRTPWWFKLTKSVYRRFKK